MRPKPIHYDRTWDGRLIVASWPECIAISCELVRRADPRYLRLVQLNTALRFSASNGSATYALLQQDAERPDVFIGEKL